MRTLRGRGPPMKRLSQLAVLVAVATAVPASPLVLAQIQKAAAPAAAQKVEVNVEKVVEPRPAVQVRKAIAADEVVVLKQAVPVAANLEPQVRQFMQQFRPAMRSEYYFLRGICSLTPEQRKLVAIEGEKALRAASRTFAEAQMRPAQVRNGRVIYPDPRRLIEEEMARLVRPHLTPDQASRYAAESERRTADRRRAAVHNFIAKLDADLVLSPAQREALAQSITSHWDESWCQSLETLLYGDQYYPRLPDDVIVPHLDEKQKDVWRGTRTNQNYFFGFVGNMMPQEDAQDDRDLIEARQAAEREMPMLPGRQLPGVKPIVVAPVAPAPPAARPAPVERAVPAKK